LWISSLPARLAYLESATRSAYRDAAFAHLAILLVTFVLMRVLWLAGEADASAGAKLRSGFVRFGSAR